MNGNPALTPDGGDESGEAWSNVGAKFGIGGATVEAPDKAPVTRENPGSTGKNMDPVRGN